MNAYIQIELDALHLMGPVATMTGLHKADVCSGLINLWSYCYREKVELIPSRALEGFFSGAEHLREALELFGFIEVIDDETLRVRGVHRYANEPARRFALRSDGRAKVSAARPHNKLYAYGRGA